MSPKARAIGSMISTTVLILVISQLATNSLNPIEVFSGGSHWILKVVVGLLMFALLMAFLSLLMAGALKDERCGDCGKALIEFATVYGGPVKCQFCKRWYHKNCFNSKGGTYMEGCKQVHCPSGQVQPEGF